MRRKGLSLAHHSKSSRDIAPLLLVRRKGLSLVHRLEPNQAMSLINLVRRKPSLLCHRLGPGLGMSLLKRVESVIQSLRRAFFIMCEHRLTCQAAEQRMDGYRVRLWKSTKPRMFGGMRLALERPRF